LGVPQLHILRAYNAQEYRFYELSGDLDDALHFSHFDNPEYEKPLKLSGRIKLKEKVTLNSKPRIVLHTPPSVKLFDGKSGEAREENKIEVKLKGVE
jgi:hypothetical protein